MGLGKLLLVISKAFVRWRPSNYLYKTTFMPLLFVFFIMFLQNIIGIQTIPNVYDSLYFLRLVAETVCGIGEWRMFITIFSAVVYLGSALFYLLTAYLSRSLLRHPYVYWLGFGLCTNLLCVTEAPLMIISGKFLARILQMYGYARFPWIFLLLFSWMVKQVIDANIISRFNVHNVHIFTVSAVLDTKQLLALIKFLPLGGFFAQIFSVHERIIYLVHSVLMVFLIIQLEIFARIMTNLLITFFVVLSCFLIIGSTIAIYICTTFSISSTFTIPLITYLGSIIFTFLALLYKYSKYHSVVEHFIRSISFIRFLEGASFMGRSSSQLYALLTTFVRNCNYRDNIPIHRFEASCIQLSTETQKMTTYFNTKIFLSSPKIMLYLIFVYYPFSLLLSFYEYIICLIPSRSIDLVGLSAPQREILLSKEHNIYLHARGQQPSPLLAQVSVHNFRLARLCELRTNGMDTVLDRHLIKLLLNFLIIRQKRVEMSILGFILLLLNDSATSIEDYKELASSLRDTGFFRYLDVYSILVPSDHDVSSEFFFIPRHLYNEHCTAMHLARRYAVPFSTSSYTEFGQILTLIFSKSISVSHTRILYSAELTMALDFAWSYFACPWVFIYFGTILEIMLSYTGMTGKKRYEERIQQKVLQFAVLTSKQNSNHFSSLQQDTTTLFNFVSLAGKNLSPAQYFYKTHLFSLFSRVDFKIFELESVYQEVSYFSLICDVFLPYLSPSMVYPVKVQNQSSKLSEFDSVYLQQRMPDGQDGNTAIVPYIPTLYSNLERDTLITVHTYSEEEVFSNFPKLLTDNFQSTQGGRQSTLKHAKNSLQSNDLQTGGYYAFLENQRLKYNSVENSEYINLTPKEVSGDEVYLVEDALDAGKMGTGTADRWRTKLASPVVYDLPPAVAVSRLIRYYAYINTSIGKNTYQRFFFGRRNLKLPNNYSHLETGDITKEESPYLNFVSLFQQGINRKRCWKFCHKNSRKKTPVTRPCVPKCTELMPSTAVVASSIIPKLNHLDPQPPTCPTIHCASQSEPDIRTNILGKAPLTHAVSHTDAVLPPASQPKEDDEGHPPPGTTEERCTVHGLLTSEQLLTQRIAGLPNSEPRVVRVAGISRDSFSIMTLVVLIDLIESIYTFEASDNNSAILTVGNTGHIFIDTLFKNNFLRLFGLLSGFIINLKPSSTNQDTDTLHHNITNTKRLKPIILNNHTLLLVLQLIYNEFCVVKKLLSSMNTIRYKDQSVLFMYYGFLRSFNFCPKDTTRLLKLCREVMPEVIETDPFPHLKSFFEIPPRNNPRLATTSSGPNNINKPLSRDTSELNAPGTQTCDSDKSLYTSFSVSSSPSFDQQMYDEYLDEYSHTKNKGHLHPNQDIDADRCFQENDILTSSLSHKEQNFIEQRIIKRADDLRNVSVIGKKIRLDFLPEREKSAKNSSTLLTHLLRIPHTSFSLYISIGVSLLLLITLLRVVTNYLGDMWLKGLVLSDYLDLMFYKYLHVIRLWSLDKQISSTTRGKYALEIRRQYETVLSANLRLACFNDEDLCEDLMSFVFSYSIPETNNTKSRLSLWNTSFDTSTNNDNLFTFFSGMTSQRQIDRTVDFLDVFQNFTNSYDFYTEILQGIRNASSILNFIRISQTHPILVKLLQVPKTSPWFWRIQPELENYAPYIMTSPDVISQSAVLPPTFPYIIPIREYIDLLSSLIYQGTYLTENDRFHIKIDDSKDVIMPIFFQNVHNTALQGVKALNRYSIVTRNLISQHLFDFELPTQVLFTMLILTILTSLLRSMQFHRVVLVIFKTLNIYQKLTYGDISRLANIIRLNIYEFAIKYYDTNALQMVLKEAQSNRSSMKSWTGSFTSKITASILQTGISSTITPAKANSVNSTNSLDYQNSPLRPSTVVSSTNMPLLGSEKKAIPTVTQRSKNLADIPETSNLLASDVLTNTHESSLSLDSRPERIELDENTLRFYGFNDSSSNQDALQKSSETRLTSEPSKRISYLTLRKMQKLRGEYHPKEHLSLFQRLLVCWPILGSLFSYELRLSALRLTFSNLVDEYQYFKSSKLFTSQSDKILVYQLLERLQNEQDNIRHRYVAIKRRMENIKPMYIFLFLFLFVILFLIVSIHVLGSLSTTLICRIFSVESSLLLTRKVHFFQHILNYLEIGIWNIRMSSKVPAYRESFIDASKNLNLEELERMFSEFYSYNVYSVPLATLSKILAPCSNIIYASLFVLKPFWHIIEYSIFILRLPFVILERIFIPTRIPNVVHPETIPVYYQLEYHPEIRSSYTSNTLLTYYKLLNYIIDTSNTILELKGIENHDSNYNFRAITYNKKNDNIQHILKKTLYNSITYSAYIQSQAQMQQPLAYQESALDYFDTPEIDIKKSASQLEIDANKMLGTPDFRSLFYLFSKQLEVEFNKQFPDMDTSGTTGFYAFKMAILFFLVSNFTDHMLTNNLDTIKLIDVSLKINYYMSIISFIVLIIVLMPILLCYFLYLFWNFYHLVSFNIHSRAFNSHRVKGYIKVLIIIGIILAGLASIMLIILSILNLDYAKRISREYNVVHSLHGLTKYHLTQRLNNLASFLDQPLAYSSKDVFQVEVDSFDKVYASSLSLIYHYGFFIPQLRRQSYYNMTELQEELENAAAAGNNETSYMAEINLYNIMPSYISSELPISIKDYIYATKAFLGPNIPFIKWNTDLSSTKFTLETMEDVFSSLYRFAELRSFSVLIQKYLRKNYVFALYTPTSTSGSPPNHVNILDPVIQSHITDLSEANIEIEHVFGRFYDGIMSLYVQNQKEYNGQLGIMNIMILCSTLLTLIAISISIIFASLPIYIIYTRMLKDLKSNPQQQTQEIPAIQIEMLLEKNGHEINSMHTTPMDEQTIKELHHKNIQPILSNNFATLPIVGTKQLFFYEIVFYTIVPILMGIFGVFFLWVSMALIYIYSKTYSTNNYVQGLPLLIESMRYITECLSEEIYIHPEYMTNYTYTLADNLNVKQKIEIKDHEWHLKSLCKLYNRYAHVLRVTLELICYGTEYVLKFGSPSTRFDEKIPGLTAEMDSTLMYWNQYESLVGRTTNKRLYEQFTELRLPSFTKIMGITPHKDLLGINANYLINLTTNNSKTVSFTLGQILDFLVPFSNINQTSNLKHIKSINILLQALMESFANQVNVYFYDRITKKIIWLFTIVIIYTAIIIILIWTTGRMHRLNSIAMFGYNILLKWKEPYIKQKARTSS